jgi:hypothetical protein
MLKYNNEDGNEEGNENKNNNKNENMNKEQGNRRTMEFCEQGKKEQRTRDFKNMRKVVPVAPSLSR